MSLRRFGDAYIPSTRGLALSTKSTFFNLSIGPTSRRRDWSAAGKYRWVGQCSQPPGQHTCRDEQCGLPLSLTVSPFALGKVGELPPE